MRSLLRTALAAVVVTGAALVAMPSPASASPTPSGLVTLSRYIYTSTGGPGGVTGTINCPVGYRLVGSGGGHGQIGAEAPTPGLTGATISAAVTDAYPNNFAYIVIYCEPSTQFTDVLTVEVRDHTVRAGSFSTGIARCPAGYYAFGGGGYFGPGFMSAAYSNASNGPGAAFDSWTFSGVAPSGANTMTTTTQCAPKIGRNFVAQFGNVSSSNNQVTSSYVYCPSGWTAIAGGFYASNPNGTEAFPSAVIWSVPASNGSWYASGYTNPGNKMVALAQCVI